uniref:ZP domain-containing protein n=1 Tax=Panagrolaimus sp. PS1159 TaxID=55785 RepID=A0AC35FEF5_9BILA
MSAELVCTDRDMQLHVLLEKPLSHSSRIFVKEQSADPHCVHKYEPNSEHNALMFRIPLSTCGMQRIQYHSTKFSFTTSIVVSFHQFFVSSYDRSFRIACDYSQIQQPPKQDVTVGVGVEEADDLDVNEVYPETAECSYKLLYRNKTSTIMEKAKTVQIGDEMEHVWTCENLRSNQFIFIHDCLVNPEFSVGNDPILIDSNGCPVDETGIGAPLNCSQKRSIRSINNQFPQRNNSIELSEIVNVEEVLTHEALNRAAPKSQISPSICPSFFIEAILLSFSTTFLFLSIFLICKSRKNI